MGGVLYLITELLEDGHLLLKRWNGHASADRENFGSMACPQK